jgi:hypothetical protein
MNERMSQLETQLQATQDELESSKTTVERQQELIEKAGLQNEGMSGLQKFLSETQFSGLVAASYNYNFRSPDETVQAFPSSDAAGGFTEGVDRPATFNLVSPTVGGVNGGALGLTAPFHSNANTFQLDQFYMSMIKPATAESRGGFGVDLAWGSSADFLGLPFQESDGDFEDIEMASGDLSHLYQAYVEYLAPIGPGVGVKLGRFEGLIGAESFRQDKNWQVTRGIVWGLQPVNHTGVMTTLQTEQGFVLGAGAVNSYSNTMRDFDNSKSFVGRIGYQGEMFGILVNGFYGGDVDEHPIFRGIALLDGPVEGPGEDGDAIALIDTIISFTPSDKFSSWVNFDYYNTTDSNNPLVSKMRIYALGAAGRFAFTERLGLALRYEFIYLEDSPFVLGPGGVSIDPTLVAGAGGRNDGWLNAFTGTFDYALTDNLKLLVEGRYDWGGIQNTPDDLFVVNSQADLGEFFGHDDQVLGLVQMLYTF